MRIHSTKSETLHSTADATHYLFDDWFGPIETGVRERVRGFIEELIEAELEEALSRLDHARMPAMWLRHTDGKMHRDGSRVR
jgi:hypothetical protein